jgi:hypothetical protein
MVMGRPIRSTYTSQRSRKPPKGSVRFPVTGTFSSAFSNLVFDADGEVVVPGDLDTSFTLTTTATTGTYPFTIGLGLARGDASDDLELDIDDYQVVVKRLWSDGSIKHAIISGRALLTQNEPLTINVIQGTSPSGTDLTRATLEAAVSSTNQNKVQCGTFGTVDLATTIASGFVRTWLQGPEMIECHYRRDVGGGTLLSVWFHVRLYADGRMWIRAIVENGYLDNGSGALAGMTTSQTYVPTITIGGSVVYNNGGASATHYKGASYSATGWIGGDPAVTALPDAAYLMSTKLVPNYTLGDEVSAATIAGTSQVSSGSTFVPTLHGITKTYTPFGSGEIKLDQSGGGYQNQIGLLPLWDSLYFSTSGDSRAYRALEAHSSLINSYSIRWRAKNTNLPAKPSDFPTWSLAGPGGGGAPTQGPGTLKWDFNHHGSAGYLAYLMTGDYWHYETMALQASMCYLTVGFARGSGVNRVLHVTAHRGIAWAFRTIGQYVAVAPDGDAIAADYLSLLTNNITHWANQGPYNVSASQIGWPVGFSTYNTSAPQSQAPWMTNFWVATNGYLWDMEPGLADTTNLLALRNWMYKGVVGLLGANGAANYCYTAASNYNITISPNVVSDVNAVTTPDTFYATWGEVYTATHGSENTACGTALGGVDSGVPLLASVGYWGNLLPAIAYAVDHGATDAQTAYDRLTGATNWQSTLVDGQSISWDDAPLWGITPRVSLPDWRTSMTSLTWALVGTNTLADVDPEDDAGVNPNYPSGAPWHGSAGQAGVMSAWGGGVWDEDERRLLIFGGGHGDYGGNELYAWNADTAAFSRLTSPTGAIGNTGTLTDGLEASGVYFDGQPRSFHTYNNLALRNGTLWCSGGSPYVNGGFTSRPFYFDAEAGSWVKDSNESIASSGSLCYDPVRDHFMCFGQSTSPPFIYDPVTHTRTSHAKGWTASAYNRSIYDPVRDAVLIAKDSDTIQIIDAAGVANTVVMTTSGTGPTGLGHIGFVYDSRADRYLWWNGGTTIYTLTPPVGDFRAGTWVWSTISVSGSNTVTPTSAPPAGTFGRFWYSEIMNCVGVVNAVTQKMYVFALGAP